MPWHSLLTQTCLLYSGPSPSCQSNDLSRPYSGARVRCLECARLEKFLRDIVTRTGPIRRRVGNTGKLGALFGILYAIGAPVPKPGSITFIVRLLFARVKNLISGEQASCHHPALSGS